MHFLLTDFGPVFFILIPSAFMNFQVVVWSDGTTKRKAIPRWNNNSLGSRKQSEAEVGINCTLVAVKTHKHIFFEIGVFVRLKINLSFLLSQGALQEVDDQPHLISAVKGFIRSIALGGQNSLQDILRLLTLWFAHGGNTDVNSAMHEGFSTISIDTWLQVVPQLIARIEHPTPAIRSGVHELLSRVAKEHPQALVYSLAVSCKSQNQRRQVAAEQILNRMRQHR
jgi:hypothetical protein